MEEIIQRLSLSPLKWLNGNMNPGQNTGDYNNGKSNDDSDRSEADQCGNCRDEVDICKDLVSRKLYECAGPLAVHIDGFIEKLYLQSNFEQSLGKRISKIHVPLQNTS